MNNDINIKNKLLQIQSELDNFEYNESEILKEYKQQYDNHNSIAIKILSVIGGFIGTLAFVGLLFLSGIYSSEIALTFIGFTFVLFAIFLNKNSETVLTDTFSISIYAVGITMLSLGLVELNVNPNIVAFLTLCIGIVAFIFTNNYIFSFLSVLTVTGSLVILLVFINKTYTLMHLYNVLIVLALLFVFLQEAKLVLISKVSKSYRSLRIGLVVSFLFSLGFFGLRHFYKIQTNWVWFFSAILITANLFVIYKTLNTLKIKQQQTKISIYIISFLILSATSISPSILGAILLILLSFYTNYKIGIVLGILSLIYFISQFYYDLNFTLLTKSILLFSSGILFLILYFLILKFTKNEKI